LKNSYSILSEVLLVDKLIGLLGLTGKTEVLDRDLSEVHSRGFIVVNKQQ